MFESDDALWANYYDQRLLFDSKKFLIVDQTFYKSNQLNSKTKSPLGTLASQPGQDGD